jgi:uncharacterized MAPEG superfamily protein
MLRRFFMTIAYWCVLAGAFLPIFFTGIAKFSGPGFDNRSPRAFQARLEGMRQRAHYAHLNGFEAFAPFAAAVIIAHQLGVGQSALDNLALSWVGLRILYGVFYMLDMGPLRSLAWLAAVLCWVAMFVLGARV